MISCTRRVELFMEKTLYLLNCITTETAVNTYANAYTIIICLMNHGSDLSSSDIKDVLITSIQTWKLNFNVLI